MPTLDVVSQDNKKVGTINLREDVFGVKVNVALVHQVIKAQLANRRQGTAKTKTRSEMQGGGKKPYRQKGTGNARHGSRRSPIFVGGATTFGPQPRSYEQATNRKMMDRALRSALTDRLNSKRLMVVDKFDLQPKTKDFQKIQGKLAVEKALVVDADNKNLELAARNLKGVKVLRAEGINVYDIIKSEWVVLTKKTVEALEKRLPVVEAKKAKGA